MESADKKVSENDILQWIFQLAQQLEKGHAKGIAHGELSDQNIYVLKRDRLTIANWNSEMKEFLYTDEQRNYSIERIQGLTPTPPDDIWAIGCIIYRICNHESAFGLKPCEADIKEKEVKLKGYSKELEQLVQNILVLDKEKRPTATQLI